MVFKKIIFQNRYVELETLPPLHGENHLKFPFLLFEPFPKVYCLYHLLLISSIGYIIYNLYCLPLAWSWRKYCYLFTLLSNPLDRHQGGGQQQGIYA